MLRNSLILTSTTTKLSLMSFKIVSEETPHYTDQKAGTSGLRKPTQTYLKNKNYLHNYVQATLTAVKQTSNVVPSTLVVGGDGRFWCIDACHIIIKLAAGNGVKKVIVGQNGLLSTPAVSALVRRNSNKPDGAFILTASHNPGGIDGDFGIKYNGSNGGPAQESLTNLIYDLTKSIKNITIAADLPDVDLNKVASTSFKIGDSSDDFFVEVVDSVADYADLMQSVFDFDSIKNNLFARKGFTFCFDAMNGIAGPYAQKIFVDLLGAPQSAVRNCVPKPDFGGLHPDPNLTYAEELVKVMGLTRTGDLRALAPGESVDSIPSFGAAADGDADRNMVLGRQFFVTPSDSVAIIAANASAIKYFSSQGGLKSVARSMPTSQALDLVAKELKLNLFEVPTGWKFFGNLMDSDVLFNGTKYTPLLCGEESFGTGSDHVREKDGIWAVLAWLSILAQRNSGPADAAFAVSVEDIVKEHWRKFGRNYYARLDYEGVESDKANAMMDHLRGLSPSSGVAEVDSLEIADGALKMASTKVKLVDDFFYKDPVDGAETTKQGIRVIFEDGSRFVFRLSGTGSSGATIRLYVESYVNQGAVEQLQKLGAMPPTMTFLNRFVKCALVTSKLAEFTGRNEPTVIT